MQQQLQRLLQVGVPKGTMLRVGSGSQAVAAAAAAASTSEDAAGRGRGRGRGRGPNVRHATGSCPEAFVVGAVSEAAPVRPIASIVRRYAKLGAVKVWDREGRALMAALSVLGLTGTGPHGSKPARKSSAS